MSDLKKTMNLCGVVVLILFALYSGCPARSLEESEETERCNDPPREQLESHWFLKGGLNGLHESFFHIPSLLGLVKQTKDVDTSFVHVRRAIMDLPSPTSKTSGDVEGGQSMCPTHQVLNYDDNRIPDTLLEANCSSQHCQVETTNGDGYLFVKCKPLVHHTRVLRRTGCKDGVYTWEPVLEPLTLTCVCMQPLGKHVKPGRLHQHPGSK